MQVKRLNTQVINPRIAKALTRLDSLLFDTLKGNDTWLRYGKDSHEFLIRWGCYEGNIQVYEVKGTLREESFRFNFVGLSTDSIQITLKKKGLDATFTSSPEYGYFSVPDNIYLKQGSSCYKSKPSNVTEEEFFAKPFAGQERSRLMTPEVESTCVTFLNDLVDTVTSR
jgi:hypothetical protein